MRRLRLIPEYRHQKRPEATQGPPRAIFGVWPFCWLLDISATCRGEGASPLPSGTAPPPLD